MIAKEAYAELLATHQRTMIGTSRLASIAEMGLTLIKQHSSACLAHRDALLAALTPPGKWNVRHARLVRSSIHL